MHNQLSRISVKIGVIISLSSRCENAVAEEMSFPRGNSACCGDVPRGIEKAAGRNDIEGLSKDGTIDG
jgi:hypothetical protein